MTPGIVFMFMSIQGINGSIPFPAAARQAYAGGARPITPAISSPETERGSAQIDKLVAGQLYTRPADRVDAATQVALGRSVDLSG
jgi:hypothetical protein